MHDDPIVAEVRKLRDEYAKQFNYDLAAICRDLRERQARGNRRVVKRQPKRPSDQRQREHCASEPTDAAEPK